MRKLRYELQRNKKTNKNNPILPKCPPHSSKWPQYTVFHRNPMLFCIYFTPATKTLHMFILFPPLPMVYSDTVSLIFEKYNEKIYIWYNDYVKYIVLKNL